MIAEALSILLEDGPLSRVLKGYEPREQQRQMLLNVLQAYENNEITLVEAGTGTGKSLAYLIPAVLWALRYKERTVISTHTIPLQEQLIHKDIPLLLKALKVDVKAVLVKGMGNYLCLRKLDAIKQEFLLFPPAEVKELETLEAWSQNTCDGSRSSLAFVPSSSVWEKVGAEYDTCNRRECPFFKKCFYFKARKQAEDAQILVINHHLLCSDLVKRREKEEKETQTILPDYTRVVLDEIHHLEDIATDFFASQVSLTEIYRTLYRLTADRQLSSTGKFALVIQSLLDVYRKDPPTEVSTLLKNLTQELPSLRWDLWHEAQAAFEAFGNLAVGLQRSSRQEQGDVMPGDAKLRLLPLHQTHPDWTNQIQPKTQNFIEMATKFVEGLLNIEKAIRDLQNEKLNEKMTIHLFEIQALASRLTKASEILKNYLKPEIPVNKVRWIEVQSNQKGKNIKLIDADLDVSTALAHDLFNKFPTIVLCSATMTTNQSFQYIRSRLGLKPNLVKGEVTEHIYASPFDYEKQAILAVPTDIPHPSHVDFIKESSEHIWKAIQASKGNAFVLFTSYSMLKSCYERLIDRLKEGNYHALKQGDNNRQTLLNQFKSKDRSVLFGTDSFWEGVDVAGEALRCVILVKLPFKVPSEPVIQARTEAITAEGGDPFFDYSLPNAVVKFKQGFGRLIRNRNDRGCVLCLDNRILNKGYGKLFLKSLPECSLVFEESTTLYDRIEKFYKKTYHLVFKKNTFSV